MEGQQYIRLGFYNKTVMIRILFFYIVCFAGSFLSHSQIILKPGSKEFDFGKLKASSVEMELLAQSKTGFIPVGSFSVSVKPTAKTISVFTVLEMYANKEKYFDTTIADLNTLQPVYRSSRNPSKEMVLSYGKEIKGFYYDRAGNTTIAINESTDKSVFDGYIYPYVFSAMPLTLGYRAKLQVYDYKPGNGSNFSTTTIVSVKNNIYKSQYSGEHKVWQVNVHEESTNDWYDYFIDKESSRIWKIEMKTGGGQQYLLTDKEIDFELVVKTPFSKTETMKLIKDGNSAISGVAYAKDNQNNMVAKGKSVFNIQKKQFAPAGTTILLIPYTAYYKEWMSVNEKLMGKGRPVPLRKEAAECIKVTTVYDDKGHFDFTNLMPGEYMVVTEFSYTHTNNRTEVIGYTDTYINGVFAGSQERTKTTQYGTEAAAAIRKNILIKKDGEKVSVILKKTGALF